MEIPSALSRLRQLVHSWIKFVMSCFVISKFSKTDNVIYLTFDDGPIEDITERIFNALKDLEVDAAFFFNGADVIRHKDLVNNIISLGYFVGNHSYYHNKHTWKQWRQELDSILKGEEIIKSLIKSGSKIYRPPFGAITPFTFLYLLIKKYKIVYWNLDSRDFEAHDINEIIESIRDVKSGDILLFHNDCNLTATHIHSIINELSVKGYRFGNLSHALQ